MVDRTYRNRLDVDGRVVAVALAVVLLAGVWRAEAGDGGKPNVLFIAVDDLRPQLGCYGNPAMISPNMDRLADEGALFTQTHCQASACAPSRHTNRP